MIICIESRGGSQYAREGEVRDGRGAPAAGPEGTRGSQIGCSLTSHLPRLLIVDYSILLIVA